MLKGSLVLNREYWYQWPESDTLSVQFRIARGSSSWKRWAAVIRKFVRAYSDSDLTGSLGVQGEMAVDAGFLCARPPTAAVSGMNSRLSTLLLHCARLRYSMRASVFLYGPNRTTQVEISRLLGPIFAGAFSYERPPGSVW
jgi:hypothetical protein